MNKSKVQIKKIGKFIRELSIVVMGIAITVSVGVWINNKNNKKDLELYLDAIKLELEKNKEDIDRLIEKQQRSEKYANYLRTTDKESLNRDTIINYLSDYYNIQVSNNKTNSFDMFKLSGVMRIMGDKELLLSIWDAYKFLDEVKVLVELGYQLKYEEMKRELPMIAAGKTDFIPMYTFYTATDWPYEITRLYKELSDTLKETVLKLEKHKS